MIRLKIVSGSRSGTTLTFVDHEPIRVGRSVNAEVRFHAEQDSVVSGHHAQIVFERGAYQLLDLGSRNGTWLNGRRLTTRKALSPGDRIVFGHPGGPEAEVEIVDEPADPEAAATTERTVTIAQRRPSPAPDAPPDAARMASEAKPGVDDTGSLKVAEELAHQMAERRARSGGERSGDTVIMLAQAMHRATARVKGREHSRWRKLLAGVGGAALVVILLLGGVVLVQQREIARLVESKASIDRRIQTLQQQMWSETDPAQLAAMEADLTTLTGSAQTALKELRARDEVRAAELATGGDELEREIRKILVKFNASTYAIPPIFRERLQFHINQLVAAGSPKTIQVRKQRYWAMIMQQFGALGLPEEMAYIAWVESGFDPAARSPAGALGLWQMTSTTAQSLGLTVNGGVDERMDPDKQTKAAATYLARLLSEFGEDSFMLVLASYNRGENGMRRALSQVAQDPGGFRKDKRDFWHLYRLKLLPEETREYVPRVLAAAIVSSSPQKYGLGN